MVATHNNYPSLYTFANNALTVLKMDPLVGHIKDVTVNINEKINEKHLIDKLINYIELSKKEIDAIINYMFNIGFSNISCNFNYTNPIHIGIIVLLLSYSINDPIMAFSPLQQFPKEFKKVDIITKKLENDIIMILNKSLKP